MRRTIQAQVAFIICCCISLQCCGKATGDSTYDFTGLRPASVSVRSKKGKYTFKGYVTATRSMPKSAARAFASSEAKSYIIRAISKYLGATDQQEITLRQFRLLTLKPEASDRLAFTAECYAELEKGPHKPLPPMSTPGVSPKPYGGGIPPAESQASQSFSKQGDLQGAFQETQTIIREAFKEVLGSQRELLRADKQPTPRDCEQFTKELEALHQFMKDEISKDIRLNNLVDRPALYELLDAKMQETFVAFSKSGESQ